MITIDGKEHEAEPLFVPVRLELRDHFMEAEGDPNRLMLVSAASVALSHPTLLGRPKVDQRRELRADLVAYGEEALHALVMGGWSLKRVMEDGSQCLLDSLREIPTDEEIAEAQDFTEARTEEDSTSSTSALVSST
tara:strand:- start:228 stop:635 length:408 start_codon:yes stop_codon:yes gene_type:complete